MKICISFMVVVMALVEAFATASLTAGEKTPQKSAIVQFGKMHETIGQQQYEGRVRFSKVVKQPHFFAVAAVEGLLGEATIWDGEITVTRVDAEGRLQPSEDGVPRKKATLLVGAYVPSWTEHPVTSEVPSDEFDGYVADTAAKAGIDIEKPFLFTVEGEFIDVRLHVINGACPIRARLKKQTLPEELQPFESEMPKVAGKIVGVFAKDEVGNLTHPATSTHAHLLFKDPASGKMVTGHLEEVGLRNGVVLRLPQR